MNGSFPPVRAHAAHHLRHETPLRAYNRPANVDHGITGACGGAQESYPGIGIYLHIYRSLFILCVFLIFARTRLDGDGGQEKVDKSQVRQLTIFVALIKMKKENVIPESL